MSVPPQDEKQKLENLERVNAELTASLAKCRGLVVDCQAKLAANSNEPHLFFPAEDESRPT